MPERGSTAKVLSSLLSFVSLVVRAGAEEDAVGFAKNVSRKTMCVPNAWRPVFAARHSQKKRICIPPGTGLGGKDTG